MASPASLADSHSLSAPPVRPEETIERSRARKFVLTHWVMLALATISMTGNLASDAVDPGVTPLFLAMIGLLGAINGLATWLYIAGKATRVVLTSTLYVDSVVGLVFFYLFGEFETPALGLLMLPLIMAPVYSARSSIWGIAFVQILVYLFLMAARTEGWLPFLPYGYMLPADSVLNPQFVALSIGAFVTATIAVAMLAGEASTDILSSRAQLQQEVAHQTRALALAKEAVERSNQELAEANLQLQATNLALAQFNAAISHDLRSPLQTITLHLEMLVDSEDQAPDLSLSPEARSRLARVLVSAHRLGRMIADLQELSRSTVDLGPLEAVDLDRLMIQVVDDLNAGMRQVGASIETVHPLPTVQGKSGLLRRLVQNLLENAIKYGGTPPRVRIGAIPATAEVVGFFVEDDGPGIDPVDHKRIFELFQRLERDQQREGTGAGLAIVHRIIQAHGGAIHVERGQQLRGARFVIHFAAS